MVCTGFPGPRTRLYIGWRIQIWNDLPTGVGDLQVCKSFIGIIFHSWNHINLVLVQARFILIYRPWYSQIMMAIHSQLYHFSKPKPKKNTFEFQMLMCTNPQFDRTLHLWSKKITPTPSPYIEQKRRTRLSGLLSLTLYFFLYFGVWLILLDVFRWLVVRGSHNAQKVSGIFFFIFCVVPSLCGVAISDHFICIN